MPPQHEQSPETTPGAGTASLSVRRAVDMTFSAGDPGGMLAPRAAAVPGSGEPAPPATASAASEASAVEEAAVRGRGSGVVARQTPTVGEDPVAEPDQPAELSVTAGAEGGEGGPSVPDGIDGEEEPPVSRGPRKTVLAAASIAGALLIAVPIALMGRTHHTGQAGSRAAAPQGVTVLATQNSLPPGGYTPSSPSASPTPTADATAHTTPHQSTPKATAEAITPSAPQDSSARRSSSPTTAASAVVQLAAAHPGRHICYRAYVSHVGWQAPVCDGGVAGAAGNRPIEAVELSTAGTSGNEGNAYTASSGWQGGSAWNWKAAANGRNLVIGNPGSGAGMKAFVTKVSVGTVCANTYVSSGVGWQTTQCGSAGAKPDYLFCGLADTTAKVIEAVVLRV